MKPINYPPRVQKLESGVNDLATLYPGIAAEMTSANPAEIMATSVVKHDWKCSLCGGHWTTAPKSRVSAYNPQPGCPKCKRSTVSDKREKRRLLKDAFPALAVEITDKKILKELTMSSHREVEWKCPKGHLYEMSVNKRVNGRGCPVCAFRRLDPGYNSIGAVRPDLTRELTNPGDARTVMANSKEKIGWKHTVDGVEHRWEASPDSRCYYNHGCLVCIGRQVQVGVNDFKTRVLDKTGYLWGEDNDCSPEEVSAGNAKVVTVYCDKHPSPFFMTGPAYSFSDGGTRDPRRCRDCTPTGDRFRSKPEIAIYEGVKAAFPGLLVESNVRRYQSLGVREVDILVDDSMAIDFNGTHWHQEGVFKPVGYHARKRAAVAALGMTYLEVEEADWRGEITIKAIIELVSKVLGATPTRP